MAETETPDQEGKKDEETGDQLKALIERFKPNMVELLPKHVSMERMFQISLIALRRDRKLAQCTGASVLGGILESVRLGLEPGAGAGGTWLIPRFNKWSKKLECTIIVDYRAIILMMKRDSDVGTVLAEGVREKDFFDYGVDGKPYLAWKPARGDRGPLVGYVAASWDRTGQNMTAIVFKTMDEITRYHKARTEAPGGPWKSDEDAMCKKTVIRPLGKLNPSYKPEIQRAIALDERAELGKAQDLALLVDPTAQPTPDLVGMKDIQLAGARPRRASEVKTAVDVMAEILLPEYGLSFGVTRKSCTVNWKEQSFVTENEAVVKALTDARGAPLKISYWPGDGPRQIEVLEVIKQ